MSTTMTKRDAVEAAMALADDVAQGRLDPAQLEQQAAAELRQLFGQVIGPGDPLWELQSEIARQAVGLGALTPEELREWAAVLDRQRGVEPSEAPEPADTPAEPESSPSVPSGPEHDPAPEPEHAAEPVADADAEPETKRVAVTEPPRPDRYDPLRGWQPGDSRRY
ncbi:hypothetical protein [Mycobacterium sp. 141]|uniref:hypothetical protein n=1 Tax=Mycobacterium sp. 141 TaxID=1120797 RepID=UPI00036BEFE8|nr:hypothetical protein [Mycobacterium sp. 141]